MVTARKREEKLQETPVSITAFTSAQLELPVWGRLYARADAALLTYFLPRADGRLATPVTWRAAAGLGFYF